TCRPSVASNNNEICSQSSNLTGTWYAAVRASGNISNVTLTITYTHSRNRENALGCATSSTGWAWRNCTEINSGTAQLRQNYANWYAYHRTRMKAAKAASSEAFSRLEGTNVRVGFRTINPTGSANVDWNIPVDSNGGIFVDSGASQNRTNWYNRL